MSGAMKLMTQLPTWLSQTVRQVMSSKSAPTNPPQYSISEILQNIEDYCVMGALGGTPFNSQEENDKLREDAVDNGRKAAEQAINQLIYTQVLEELQELRKDATTQEMRSEEH